MYNAHDAAGFYDDYVSQVVARWGPVPRRVMSYGAETQNLAAQASAGFMCWVKSVFLLPEQLLPL